MAWGNWVTVLGGLAIAAFFLGPLIMENVVYDSASEANSEVDSSSFFDVNAGTKVSFVGNVRSTSEDLFDFCAMVVDGFDGYIICQNDNYASGEKVLVEGYVYGYDGDNIVIGSSTTDMYFGSVSPAQVSRPWWPAVCTFSLVVGIVMIVAGAIGMAQDMQKRKGTVDGAQQYYQPQPAPGQYYVPPPQQYYQPVMQYPAAPPYYVQPPVAYQPVPALPPQYPMYAQYAPQPPPVPVQAYQPPPQPVPPTQGQPMQYRYLQPLPPAPEVQESLPPGRKTAPQPPQYPNYR